MCSDKAIKDLNVIGMMAATNGEVLRRWHHNFAHNSDMFPGPPSKADKRPVLLIFECDPEAMGLFISHASVCWQSNH